jgi:integrase/recombinase XerD
MDGLFGVRMAGPLTPYAPGFSAELTRLGYTLFSTRGQLGLVAHLSRWLDGEGLDVGALAPSTVEAFLAARRDAGYHAYSSPTALGPLLGYLRGLGAAPAVAVLEPSSPLDVALERFRGYLLGERGLTVAAARGYIDMVRPFVAGRAHGDVLELADLVASDVTVFMVAQSGRFSPKTMQRLASALRSLLRFWHLEGVLATSLIEAVPKVAYRPPGLPRALQPAQVAALLASCRRERVEGLRDYAILLLLSRLGLRAGEVADLRLEDLDWRGGQITVRGKGNRRDLLPLPVEVGQAVAGYLRAGRPAAALDRCVFVRVKAPHRGLTGTGVTQAVAAAGRRAGLGTIHAHRLRHSAATAMLAAGAPLTEIGQVLRHRRPLTTAIYAKVDTEALRPLARPWPSGVA